LEITRFRIDRKTEYRAGGAKTPEGFTGKEVI
jgi:hypothetical protein